MSTTVPVLLQRNLDVFAENDPVRRRAMIDESYAEDCVFYDPTGGVFRGRDEIHRIAGEIKATHPDFQYQPIAEPDVTGDGGRIRWVSGRPGDGRLTLEQTSSSPGRAVSSAFISSSTSFPK